MFKPTAKLWNKDARRQAFSNAPLQSARVFKEATRRRMVESTPSGKIDNYETTANNRGRGFQRRFRRSAKGQRPAVETTTLINAITTARVSENEARVFIAGKRNPRNGALASNYAAILQNRLNRLIMTGDDRRIAQIEFTFRCRQIVRSLL